VDQDAQGNGVARGTFAVEEWEKRT
jgi:hypothetical protein